MNDGPLPLWEKGQCGRYFPAGAPLPAGESFFLPMILSNSSSSPGGLSMSLTLVLRSAVFDSASLVLAGADSAEILRL
jgi:hypothetical protein